MVGRPGPIIALRPDVDSELEGWPLPDRDARAGIIHAREVTSGTCAAIEVSVAAENVGSSGMVEGMIGRVGKAALLGSFVGPLTSDCPLQICITESLLCRW